MLVTLLLRCLITLISGQMVAGRNILVVGLKLLVLVCICLLLRRLCLGLSGV